MRTLFHNERATLARVQHPNIAQLLDGGDTPSGTPYVVMEFVDGQPIDEYVRDGKLTLTRTLELVRQLCHATQRAHEALVIHRDIKPPNVLVDSHGQPKLVDFGIAKSFEQSATTTLHPAFTPAYGSPEQRRGEPLTTASDVYSIGALLYRLLSGAKPTLTATGLLQPPSVQHAVSSEGTTWSAKDLRGDLDVIVLRALAEDASRRYATAAELGDEIERFQNHLPIVARKDSPWYLAHRFFQRNRLGVVSAAVALFTLVIGVIAFAFQAREAERGRAAAVTEQLRTQAVLGFLTSVLEQPKPQVGGKNITVREALDSATSTVGPNFANDPDVGAAVHMTLASTFIALDDPVAAIRQLESAIGLYEKMAAQSTLANPLALAKAYSILSNELEFTGDLPRAREYAEKAQQLYDADPDGDVLNHVYNLAQQAGLASRRGDHAMEGALLDRAFAMIEDDASLEARSAEATLLGRLATHHAKLGDRAANEAALRRAVDIYRSHFPKDPLYLRQYSNLATSLRKQGRFEEAATMYEDVIELADELADPTDFVVVWTKTSLANTLLELDRGDAALRLAIEMSTVAHTAHRDNRQVTAYTARTLGAAHCASGNHADGVAALRQSIEDQLRLTGNTSDSDVASARVALADCLVALDRPVDAITELRQAETALMQTYGLDHEALLPLRAKLRRLSRSE